MYQDETLRRNMEHEGDEHLGTIAERINQFIECARERDEILVSVTSDTCIEQALQLRIPIEIRRQLDIPFGGVIECREEVIPINFQLQDLKQH